MDFNLPQTFLTSFCRRLLGSVLSYIFSLDRPGTSGLEADHLKRGEGVRMSGE